MCQPFEMQGGDMPGENPSEDDYLIEEMGPEAFQKFQQMTPEEQNRYMNDPANGFVAPSMDGLFDEHMAIEDELMHIEPNSASRPMLEQRWRELDQMFQQTVPGYKSSPPPAYQPKL